MSLELNLEILTLPVVPMREGILFPSTESVLTFGRALSIDGLKASEATKGQVIILTQKDKKVDQPELKDLYQVGTLAIVEKIFNADKEVNALVRSIKRVRVLELVALAPTMVAKVQVLSDLNYADDEQKALAQSLQREFRRAVHLGKPVEFLSFMKLMSGVNDGELSDQVLSTLNLNTSEKQKFLEIVDIKERLKQALAALVKEMKILEIEKDVVFKTEEKFSKSMRENVLRERLKTIQKELGELDDETEVLNDYEAKLKKTKFENEEIKLKVKKEIKKLKQMSVHNPEAGYLRSWLDTIFDLPWGKFSQTKADLTKAGKILNQNHYGLADIKDRILEYIAVLELHQRAKRKKSQHQPTILCFVGPPGVGKTSIGRSIAQALNRQFTKVSLGGIRDEAEIRGHRRTYVGAMAGRIINGLKQAKSSNPVFMLDEIDKIGNDFRGDPSAALLEALDPEQNHGFEDHYLDLPFDLSQVMFITTANTLETIPPALRDRLEIISFTGYTKEEKLEIAKRHLWAKVLAVNGLKETQVTISDQILQAVIERYTKEAGVRDLERTLNKLLRKIAKILVAAKNKKSKLKLPIKIDQAKLKKLLGPEEYDVAAKEKKPEIGLATGLAWTPVGGDVLFVEVALTPGKGQIKLTGKLGDVMKESAQAALTYVKAHAADFKLKPTILDKTDVHIHVPEGAVPKDGPSAGITIATALVSALTKTPVRPEVAMTGEITLRGRVLRIGGLKEKSIAAHRAGITTVIIPQDNKRDLGQLPITVKKQISFQGVTSIDRALKLALKT